MQINAPQQVGRPTFWRVAKNQVPLTTPCRGFALAVRGGSPPPSNAPSWMARHGAFFAPLNPRMKHLRQFAQRLAQPRPVPTGMHLHVGVARVSSLLIASFALSASARPARAMLGAPARTAARSPPELASLPPPPDGRCARAGAAQRFRLSPTSRLRTTFAPASGDRDSRHAAIRPPSTSRRGMRRARCACPSQRWWGKSRPNLRA